MTLLQRITLLAPAFHILHNTAFRKATDQPCKAAVVMAVRSGIWWGLLGLEDVHIPKERIPEQGVQFGFPDLYMLVITPRKLWKAFPTASGGQGLWEVHVRRTIGVLSLLPEDERAWTWSSL